MEEKLSKGELDGVMKCNCVKIPERVVATLYALLEYRKRTKECLVVLDDELFTDNIAKELGLE